MNNVIFINWNQELPDYRDEYLGYYVLKNSNLYIGTPDGWRELTSTLVGDLDDLETTFKDDIVGAINELKRKIVAGGASIDDEDITDYSTWSSMKISEEIESLKTNDVTPTDMPCVFFEGPVPTTKEQGNYKASCHIYSSHMDEDCYATLKVQGNSSTKYNKKNFTITFYSDPDCTIKKKIDFGWGPQSKYVIKANWIDITHSRNVVSAKLWGDIVKSRPDYADLPELLRTSPNQGAVDGFPIKFYGDDVYWGRYTMNIPKDAWMSNMDKNNPDHLILCGEGSDSSIFRAPAVWDETDWTDELHSEVPTELLARFNQFISFVRTSSDADFMSGLYEYADVQSMMDYYIYGLLVCNLDGFKKNQLWFSYDGQKFMSSAYDLDSTFGLYWDGTKLLESSYDRTSFEDLVNGKAGNLLYMRFEKIFISELISNFNRLTSGPMSFNRVLKRFEDFISIAPQTLVQEDYASTTGGGKCTGIPSKTTNNIQQIRKWYKERLAWVANYLLEVQNSSAPEIEYSSMYVTVGDVIDIVLESGQHLESSDVEIVNDVVSPINAAGTYTVNVVSGLYTVKVIAINVRESGVVEPTYETITVDVNDPIVIELNEGESLTSTTAEIIDNVVSPITQAGTYIVDVISDGNIIKVITINVNALPEPELVTMSVYVDAPIVVSLNAGDVMTSDDVEIVDNTISPISQVGTYTINVTNGKYLVKIITLNITEVPIETYNIRLAYNVNNTSSIDHSDNLTFVTMIGDNDISGLVNASIRTAGDVPANTAWTTKVYTYPVPVGSENVVLIKAYDNGELVGKIQATVTGARTITCNAIILPEATLQWVNEEFDGVLTEFKPINTGLTLCDSTHTDWTIVVRWNMTSAPSSYTPRVAHCMYEASPYPGFTLQSTTNSTSVGLNINKGSTSTLQTKVTGLGSKNACAIRRIGDVVEYSRNGKTWTESKGIAEHNMPLIIGGASGTDGNVATVNGREMYGTVTVKYWTATDIDDVSSMFLFE